jgi:hypothetical protein
MLKPATPSPPARAIALDFAADPLDLRDSDFPSFADAHLPTFETLRRCTWGTHVTVHGQPAKFHQAGVIDGRDIVIVLATLNPTLAAACRRSEAACCGEIAYYFDYAGAGIQLGTPTHAPLLRDQAAWLRVGDTVQVNGCLCTFLESKQQADALWLTLRSLSPGDDALADLGADRIECAKWGTVWRQLWSSGLRLHLVSTRLATFAELGKLRPGTPCTIGADAVRASLRSTQVRDRTKQYVLVEAAPWLSLHQADSQPLPESRNWLYRIRFEESGLRLAEHTYS